MKKVGIIGANGYTGGELIRLLSLHPEVNLYKVGSRSLAGTAVGEVHRHCAHLTDLFFTDSDVSSYVDCDVVFLALPHGQSSVYAKALLAEGVRLIDLGADFRLNDTATYATWYASEHACPEMMRDTVYGLPELYRERIAKATLVANPGCFPTSIILALAPLLKNGLGLPERIVCDSDSGVTGAGKTLTDATHFPNINDNLAAYKIGAHRHQPEIKQELDLLAGADTEVIFNPHLVPINRGILSTITVGLSRPIDEATLLALYRDYYHAQPFVRVRDRHQLPEVKWVQGSNFCDVAPVVVSDKTVVLVSAIDNLVKGAAGQAIQNMNIMYGWDEVCGLQSVPLCP